MYRGSRGAQVSRTLPVSAQPCESPNTCGVGGALIVAVPLNAPLASRVPVIVPVQRKNGSR